jgi:membrane-associated phospholipid phosphatase
VTIGLTSRTGSGSPATSALLDARARRLGLLAGAGVVLFGALYAIAVETRWGHRAGNAALAGRHHQAPDLVRGSLDLLNTVSVASLAVAGGTICVIGLARGGWRLGIGAGSTILLANVTTQVLKRVILTRPQFADQGDAGHIGNSLPSGHATVAMSLAVGIALISPPRYRATATATAGLYAMAVGAATITAGWHRPSDVMAASLVTGVWGAVVAAILIAIRDRSPVANRSAEVIERERLFRLATGGGAALLAAAIATLMGLMVNQGWADLKTAQLDAAYWTGVTAGGASVLVVLGTLVSTLSRIDLAALAGHRLDLPFD